MVLTKSQKRHLKKVAKRKAKKEERKSKQLQEQEGKFIWENLRRDQDYSPEFTSKAATKLIEDIKRAIDVRDRKEDIQKLLLRWPTEYPRDQRFYYLKRLLDTYRALKENSKETLETIIRNELR